MARIADTCARLVLRFYSNHFSFHYIVNRVNRKCHLLPMRRCRSTCVLMKAWDHHHCYRFNSTSETKQSHTSPWIPYFCDHPPSPSRSNETCKMQQTTTIIMWCIDVINEFSLSHCELCIEYVNRHYLLSVSEFVNTNTSQSDWAPTLCIQTKWYGMTFWHLHELNFTILKSKPIDGIFFSHLFIA